MPQFSLSIHKYYTVVTFPFMMTNRWTGHNIETLKNAQNSILDLTAKYHSKKNSIEIRFEEINFETSESIKLNVIKCTTENTDTTLAPMVITHGYNAGLAFFADVMSNIAVRTKKPVYASDWLGFGGSDRVVSSETEGFCEAVDFFLAPFSEFVNSLKVVEFDLMGHSFGGYLSGYFASNYSKSENPSPLIRQCKARVRKLILASAVGIPEEDPSVWKSQKVLDNPYFQRYSYDADKIKDRVKNAIYQKGFTANEIMKTLTGPKSLQIAAKGLKAKTVHGESMGLKAIQNLSDENVIQKTLVVEEVNDSNCVKCVEKAEGSRETILFSKDPKNLPTIYYHQILTGGKSGEALLPKILKLGAWALHPLVHELPKLNKNVEVLFINGIDDWMNICSFHDTIIPILEQSS